MSKSGTPNSKGLGGAKKPTGIAGAVKKITTAVSKGKAPTPPKAPAFKQAEVKSTARLKPASPIIGTRGNTSVNGPAIEKDRMKDRVKKAGLGGL
ncbi:MAG TPA: hypothetical protein VD997_06430 [Phycisphaerales bacterium]|nr:hypothetical protein [Phycisphaerales bacterium]